MDLEGFVKKVTLFPMMFLNGLRLPLCCPIQGILDFVELALVQLHPIKGAWCC